MGIHAEGDLSKPVELKKQITLFQAVSICVGYMIGSGIFVSPYGVLLNVRSVGMALAMWVFCGIFNMVGALCYAELGTTITRSGGEYTYILRGFGRFPAFICLWTTYILVLAVMTTACSLIFATYILTPVFPDCAPPEEAVKMVAVITMLSLMIVNCFNVRWAAKVQIVFAISAVVALVMIIGIGVYAIGTGQGNSFDNAFVGSDYSPSAMAVAFYSGFWAYSGWNSLNSIAGEIKNPSRNLPLAIVISISLVTVVYVLTNVAYMAILSVDQIMTSTAVAVTFAEHTLGRLSWIMPVFVACSIIGTINGGLMAVSRVFFIGAQDGNFPVVLSMINFRFLTPAPAIIATTLLSVLMVQYNDIFFLIEVVGFAQACILATTYASMLYLRFKHPEIPRPVKLPIVLPSSLLLLFVLLLGLTIYRKPWDSAISIGIMTAGIPAYVFGVMWKNKPKVLRRGIDTITTTLQKVFLIVPQETPFGDDVAHAARDADDSSSSSDDGSDL